MKHGVRRMLRVPIRRLPQQLIFRLVLFIVVVLSVLGTGVAEMAALSAVGLAVVID